MNTLWEMTLVLYIVAYFLKCSILTDRKCWYGTQFLSTSPRAMPLLSKCFDAYLLNPLSKGRNAEQIEQLFARESM